MAEQGLNTQKGVRGRCWYSRGLVGWESIGIMSLARVALRAASERSKVDMLLPTSSVSAAGEKKTKHKSLVENLTNKCLHLLPSSEIIGCFFLGFCYFSHSLNIATCKEPHGVFGLPFSE